MSEKEQVTIVKPRRKKKRWGTIVLSIFVLCAAAFAVNWYLGSKDNAQADQAETASQAPLVLVSKVQLADLGLTREYIGRVEPIQSVAIKPQVTGEIAKVHFTEGSIVKEGDLLFTLDDNQYKATVDLRKADLQKAEANLDWAVKYHDRLKASDKRSVSASDIDAAQNQVNQSRASVSQAKASLRLAQIDLEHTKIKAPITGQIGRAEYTKGNYVSPQSAALASIVQIDPIRVTYSMPDRDYLEQIDTLKKTEETIFNSKLIMPDGREYPEPGERDFENNVMDRATGTIVMNVKYKNADGFLVPGTMVRVVTKPVADHVSPVIPLESVMSDGQGDYVYTVDSGNVVRESRIELGRSVGAMGEVVAGLDPGDSVVVSGLQLVRPDMTVAVTLLNEQSRDANNPSELAKQSVYDLETFSPEEMKPKAKEEGRR